MDAQPLLFTLQDASAGYEVTPQRVPLAVLRDFTQDVQELLQGDAGELDARAWRDVPDASAWVDGLRGGTA